MRGLEYKRFHSMSHVQPNKRRQFFCNNAVKCEDAESVLVQTTVSREFSSLSVNLICSASHSAGISS